MFAIIMRVPLALASNTVFFLTASSLLWVAAAVAGQPAVPNPLPLIPTAALAYLTLFGTLASFAAFFYLLKHVRLSTAMTLPFVTPMIAVLIDGLFEKQVILTIESYVGMAVVLVGVAATVVLRARNDSH
jgi:drug/metabolite transporter (DMT)-like permease